MSRRKSLSASVFGPSSSKLLGDSLREDKERLQGELTTLQRKQRQLDVDLVATKRRS